MSTIKINCTKNYRLFVSDKENRPVDRAKHRGLLASMKAYGFLRSFPLSCHRNGDKHLVIKDGQHRLLFAEELGLPVYWVEEAVDYDVAVVNTAQEKWTLADYAKKYATNGLQPYIDGLAFMERHKLPIGTAFALLAGTTGFTNISQAFKEGKFKVKDQKWADDVAMLYTGLIALSHEVRNARLIEACMAVCRVPEFDIARLLHGAKRCRDKLLAYSTRDAFLDMLEEVYNFGRAKLVGIKIEAIKVMRDRYEAVAKKRGKTST